MNKICTSIEQSKKLIELGIDVNSADMRYKLEQWIDDDDCPLQPITYPCWSLTALLELIPNWTMHKTGKLNLICNLYGYDESCYEEPVDAAFEMICWLLENNKI